MDAWLVLLAGIAALSFPLAFSVAKEIGLDPLQLVWQNKEWSKWLRPTWSWPSRFFSREGL